MNVAARFDALAAAAPNQVALIDTRGEVTREEIARRVSAGAAGLERAGLEPGDAVIVMLPMSVELYVAVMAVLRAGLVAAFVDPGAPAAVTRALCDRVQPRAFIGTARAQWLTLLKPAFRRIPLRFNTGLPWRGRRWPTRSSEHVALDVPSTHPAIVTCTSGSTGEPKIASRTHGFLERQHKAVTRTVEPRDGDREMVSLPVVGLATLAAGQTLVIPDADLRRPGRVDAAPVLAQIRRHAVDTLIASPALVERLVRHPDAESSLTRVRRVITGGGPVFPSLCEAIERKAPHAVARAVYGSTEAEPIAEVDWNAVGRDDRAAMRGGEGLLAGRPVEGLSVRVLTNRFGNPRPALTARTLDADTLAPGEVGEIVVSGPHVLAGYVDGIGDAETKFQVDGDTWHRTGDAGAFDAEGRLWLLGRAGQLGEHAEGDRYPFAVETAAMSLGDMRRTALAVLDGQRWLLYERDTPLSAGERDELAWARIDRFERHPIPVDTRHNSKVDHAALTVLVRTLATS